MNKEPIKILRDILINCMTLTNDQIFNYNQGFKLPETSGLFIIINYLSSQVYSATNTFIPSPEGDETNNKESISALTKEDYMINVISKNNDARQRKEEVILSLNSNFSKEQQGKYQFRIANVSNSFTNVSELEGAAMVNRFAINISLLAHYNKTIDTTIYDTFTNEIEEN